jgi:hemolysin D
MAHQFDDDTFVVGSANVAPSRLQRALEAITDRLRATRWPWRRGGDVIPVQVDLVGDTGVRQRLSGTPAPGMNPFLKGNPEELDPRTATVDSAPPATAGGALTEPWSFREAVVLRPTGRSSRVLLYTALGFTGASVLWLVVAPLNQTVAVQGKLEPDSKVKTIQTPVQGVVDAVLVEEGETVKAGQVLLRFDLSDAQSKLKAAETVRSKLVDENRIYAVALGDRQATAGLTANQQAQLRNQAADLLSRRQAAEQDLARSQARLAGYRQALATATNIAKRYDQLARTGAVSEVQKLETQAKVDELESNVQQELREQARLGAALRSSTAGPNAEYRGRIETNLRQIADLDRQIREARLQLQYSELKAPASGTVFDLDARRGSVAQAAQPLLKVVPNDGLRAKVYVPSSAIGFIHTGQQADLSLDTFPAADYGRLEATVVRVGSDALTPDKQKEALGTEAAGLHYPAVLELSRQSLQAGKRRIPLQPGMGLTADIHLRQRRMINVVTGFFEDKLRSLERMR